MSVALLSAMRSKDKRTQIGACIVGPDKRIIGMGYNGFPRGCPDEEYPTARGRDEQGHIVRLYDSKHAYIVHAEANAILNSMGKNMNDSTLYCTLPTCNECAKLILQTGIKRVVYLPSVSYESRDEFLAAKRMYESAGIVCETYTGETHEITLHFDDQHGKSER